MCSQLLSTKDWVKPFNDVIDWSSVVVDGDERLLLQLPEMLRSFDRSKLERMRSQSLAIYENYFSSVERIVLTTIAILTDRIQSHLSLNSFLWNCVNPGFSGFTGALWFDSQYSQDVSDFPGYRHQQILSNQLTASAVSPRQLKGKGRRKSGAAIAAHDEFTCVIYVNKAVSTSALLKLVKNISRAKQLAKVSLSKPQPENPRTKC